MTLTQIKWIATLISLVVGFGGLGYVVNEWHYAPLKDKDKQIVTLKMENTAQERTIKNLGTQIQKIIADNKVNGFEEFFEGGGDVEVNPYNGNIFLKRVQ